jgi:hypothetical protein
VRQTGGTGGARTVEPVSAGELRQHSWTILT